MKVRYSPRASYDLDSIYEFLDQHSPAGAARVMAAIYAAVEFIRRNPHASEMTSFRGVRGESFIGIDSNCFIDWSSAMT
jgi:plasmid stabilization system protein ParE